MVALDGLHLVQLLKDSMAESAAWREKAEGSSKLEMTGLMDNESGSLCMDCKRLRMMAKLMEGLQS